MQNSLWSDFAAVAILILAGVGIVAFMIGLAGGTLWIMHRRHTREGQAWSAAAAQLGLQLRAAANHGRMHYADWRETSTAPLVLSKPQTTHVMSGYYREQQVVAWITQYLSGRSSLLDAGRIQRNEFFTVCQTRIDPSIGLELVVTGKLDNWASRLIRSMAGEEIPVGYAPFDQRFSVESRTPAHRRTLLLARLRDGTTCAERFAAAAEAGWFLLASDTAVSVQFDGKVLSAEKLADAFAVTSELARKLDEAARLLPPMEARD